MCDLHESRSSINGFSKSYFKPLNISVLKWVILISSFDLSPSYQQITSDKGKFIKENLIKPTQ